MKSDAIVADSICPLCGNANRCAISSGIPAKNCWCQGADISAPTLAKIPPELAGKSCICPGCAKFKGAHTIE